MPQTSDSFIMNKEKVIKKYNPSDKTLELIGFPTNWISILQIKPSTATDGGQHFQSNHFYTAYWSAVNLHITSVEILLQTHRLTVQILTKHL